MPKKGKNVLLDILKYGESKLNANRDFQEQELVEHLKTIGHNDTVAKSAITSFLKKDNFDEIVSSYYRINSTGYSILLTDNSLKVAWRGIWIAIGVAVITTGAAIFVPILIDDDTARLTDDQFNALIDAIKKR